MGKSRTGWGQARLKCNPLALLPRRPGRSLVFDLHQATAKWVWWEAAAWLSWLLMAVMLSQHDKRPGQGSTKGQHTARMTLGGWHSPKKDFREQIHFSFPIAEENTPCSSGTRVRQEEHNLLFTFPRAFHGCLPWRRTGTRRSQQISFQVVQVLESNRTATGAGRALLLLSAASPFGGWCWRPRLQPTRSSDQGYFGTDLQALQQSLGLSTGGTGALRAKEGRDQRQADFGNSSPLASMLQPPLFLIVWNGRTHAQLLLGCPSLETPCALIPLLTSYCLWEKRQQHPGWCFG